MVLVCLPSFCNLSDLVHIFGENTPPPQKKKIGWDHLNNHQAGTSFHFGGVLARPLVHDMASFAMINRVNKFLYKY